MKLPTALASLCWLLACGVPTTPAEWAPEDPANPAFSHDPTKRPEQPAAVTRATLTTFNGPTACADLEQRLEDQAVLQMRVRLEDSRKWALQDFQWRAEGGGSWGTADSGAASGAGGGSAGSGPTDYTTTNVQEAGIDEPDFVKNDGTRMLVLSGHRLHTLSTWPANALAARGSIELTGRPREMFLDGNRVLVFSEVLDPSLEMPSWCVNNTAYCEQWLSNAVVITHVDVSDLEHPQVVATQRVPGGYESARRVGDVVRVVTTSSFPFVDGLPTWIDWDRQRQATSLEELSALFDQRLAENAASIRARTLSQWTAGVLLSSNGTSVTPQLECGDVWVTSASARLGLTSIVSLDLSNPLAFRRQALLAAVDELYQGPESLYLGQRQWWWWGTGGDGDATYLYRFDLAQRDAVHFVAAGRVDGQPVNQFALDEHQGVLRVATTDRLPDWSSVNRVVTLGAVGEALVELGRTADLAPGERIMSARFFDDRAYVVTFRQVDPLYVIDLVDPAKPRMVGELKIPGFSSYLHPLDATHLLTIGVISDPSSPTPWMRQLQLQLFDVSDSTQPRQTHSALVGEAWGWSEAQWDHKAFNFFAARGTLAIPFADYWEDPSTGAWSLVSDLRVYQVDAQAGFTFKGRLGMADVVATDCNSGWSCWSWGWMPNVRRSVMADEFVYAISSGGVRVAQVDALATPIATARFAP